MSSSSRDGQINVERLRSVVFLFLECLWRGHRLAGLEYRRGDCPAGLLVVDFSMLKRNVHDVSLRLWHEVPRVVLSSLDNCSRKLRFPPFFRLRMIEL